MKLHLIALTSAVALLSVSIAKAQMNHAGSMNGSMGQKSMGVSAADSQAFASVYDLLDEDIRARQNSGMLFGSAGASNQNFATPQPQVNPDYGNQPFPNGDVMAAPEPETPNPFPDAQDPFAGQDPFAAEVPVPPQQSAQPAFQEPFPLPDGNGGFPPEITLPEPNQLEPDQIAGPIPGDDISLDQQLGLEDDFADLPDLDDEEPLRQGFLGGLLSNVYLGAYGAATYAQGSSSTFGTATYDNAPKPAYGGGAIFGTKLGPLNIEAEGHYSQTTTESESSSDTTVYANEQITTRTSIIGLANAYYKLRFGSFGAFAGGSVGYGQLTEENGVNTEVAQGLVYGPLAGVTYQVSDQIELAAQYRYLLSGDLDFTDETTNLVTQKAIADHQALLAVRFKF